MFISCGQDELYRSPKKAYFSCLIGLYFLSFFYEHPVDCSGTKVYINFNSPKALIIKLSLVFYKKMHFLFFHFYLFC